MKDKILEQLNQSDGFISGEELSRKMNISRTAVWKHIQSLIKEGYEIEAVNKMGYCLKQRPDNAYEAEIRRYLKTKSLGRSIKYYTQLGSTNDVAKDLAEKNAPHGLLVVAEEQIKGKGRLGRTWHSPAGTSIFMTVLLRPLLTPEKSSQLTLLSAVAVAQALKNLSVDGVSIKWPNDVQLFGKKICGILLEIRADMDGLQWAIIGLGVNVKKQEFPREFAGNVSSVEEITGKIFRRSEIAAEIINVMEELYEDLLQNGFEFLRQEWLKLNSTLGRKIKVRTLQKELIGMAEDIDAEGFLLLRMDNGDLQKITAGDVMPNV